MSQISGLVPDDTFVGMSLILRHAGRLLYGCRPAFAENSRHIVELTGIGGGMEDEDESLTAGVQREAREEIGCGVRLVPCDETVVVRGRNHVERIGLQGSDRPAAVVFRGHRMPPHQPWHATSQDEGCLVVFLAELRDDPHPTAELPALIWLKPAHVIETARRDVPLRELLAAGADLRQRTPNTLPEDAWARLTDSQEALVIALKDDTLNFYHSLRKPRNTSQQRSLAILLSQLDETPAIWYNPNVFENCAPNLHSSDVRKCMLKPNRANTKTLSSVPELTAWTSSAYAPCCNSHRPNE